MTGLLLLDKEEGWTSHDAVARLRGQLGERRIGHAGTLDPMATGLLVILLGRGTRAAEFAEAQEKEYEAVLRLGQVTDTQDVTGATLSESELLPDEAALCAVLPRFTGEIAQIPPMYSAIKVHGQKLYDIARRGGEIERAPRPVTIHALELLSFDGRDARLRVVCSKGTYIRTLCHDIGAALGCGGCMAALRRTRCGQLRVADACLIRDASAERVLPLDSLFSDLPALTLSAAQERRCRCGNTFRAAGGTTGRCRFYSENGEFLALGELSGGEGRSVKSFFEVNS